MTLARCLLPIPVVIDLGTDVLRAAIVVLMLTAACVAQAKPAAVKVENAWIAAPPQGASVIAAYLMLRAHGPEGDRLLSASSPIAGRVEIHETTLDQGMASMRPVRYGVRVAPNAPVEFKPGGMHLMLFLVDRPLARGEAVPLTLQFERAGAINATAIVRTRPIR